jgi:hypothetical protein
MSYRSHPAADLFPLMEDDELQALADDIKERGLRDPIVMDRDGRIIDGRNRWRACNLAGVQARSVVYEGDDPIAESLSRNLKRRHLTESQRGVLALKVLPLREAEARERMSAGGAKKGGHQRPPLPRDKVKPKRSRDVAGKDVGVGGRTVAQAKRVKEKAPDLLPKVEAGEMDLKRAERIIRDREAEARRVDEAKQEAAALEIKPTVDIRHGDFREVLADLQGVDAIITDPPYPREYLPLLDDLAAWADKVLTPDGVLVILFGQSYLPEVYRRLDGHRPYRWTACYETPGGGYVSHLARCHSSWKPLLIYGGGPRFGDVFSAKGSDASAKNLHHWGQDYGAFHDIVGAFTKPGQTVVDPFMGAGTTLLAGYAQGRNVIGCDIDAEHVATTRRRLDA